MLEFHRHRFDSNLHSVGFNSYNRGQHENAYYENLSSRRRSHHSSQQTRNAMPATMTKTQRQLMFTFPVSPMVANGMEVTRNVCFTCWRASWEIAKKVMDVTTYRIVPSTIVMYRLSVLAIAWDQLLKEFLCWHASTTTTDNKSDCMGVIYNIAVTAIMKSTTTTTTNLPSWVCTLVYLLLFLLPLVLLFLMVWMAHCVVLSGAFFWPCRMTHQVTQVVLLAATLVSVLCLEALFPLTVLCCTSLVLLQQQLSWTTAIVIMGGAYLFGSTRTRWTQQCLLHLYLGWRD